MPSANSISCGLQDVADEAARAAAELETVTWLLTRDRRKLRELIGVLHLPAGEVFNIGLRVVAHEVRRRNVPVGWLREYPCRVTVGRLHSFVSTWDTDGDLAEAGITGSQVAGAAVAGVRILHARLVRGGY